MADATAWILVSPMSEALGSEHFTPTHLLTLTENDRASWTLTPIDRTSDGEATWVPFSPHTFVDDAMLMMGIHVFQDEPLLEVASRSIPNLQEERVDLNMKADSATLETLYERCQSMPWKCMMAVSVLSHSSMRPLLDNFARYPFKVRLCLESDS